MLEEKGALELEAAQRTGLVKGLLEQYGIQQSQPATQDEDDFNKEWIRRCEEKGGSWGEKRGFKAVAVDDSAAWECVGCPGSYFAYHLDPKKEEFWGVFECCDEDCRREEIAAKGHPCPSPTPGSHHSPSPR